MAVDTFVVLVGVYPSVDAAESDFAVVNELFSEKHLVDMYDAAIVERRPDGKVKLGKKHETLTRVGGVAGAGLGLATGLVVALFPFAAVGGGLLAGTAGGGALLGALAGHAAGGMSRADLMELGEQLDAGQSGLVVVAVADLGHRAEVAMKGAETLTAKELKVSRDDLVMDAKESTDSTSDG